MMELRSHWEIVHATKASHEVSWYQPHLRLSLELIGRTGIAPEASLIDIDGGDSTFHFLTDAEDHCRYVTRADDALKLGGHLILAAFALDGPDRCSGLQTMRYSSETLGKELGGGYELVESQREGHCTPGGIEQRFLYCHFQKRP